MIGAILEAVEQRLARIDWERYHEHPLHGWLNPEGEFTHVEEHPQWIADELQLEPGEAMDQAFALGWIRLGPDSVDTGFEPLTRTRLSMLQRLFRANLKHVGNTIYFDTGGESFSVSKDSFFASEMPTQLRRSALDVRPLRVA